MRGAHFNTSQLMTRARFVLSADDDDDEEESLLLALREDDDEDEEDEDVEAELAGP